MAGYTVKRGSARRSNMASKYQGKKQGKAKSKDVKPVVACYKRAPVFLYTSDCCGELSKKTACVVDKGVKFEERKASLGKWKCSSCRKTCKVTRKFNKESIIPFSPKALVPSAILAFAELLVPGSVERVLNGII